MCSRHICSTNISEECFRHLVESMPRRIKAVLKAKGGPTFYYQGVPNKVAGECTYIYTSLYFAWFFFLSSQQKSLHTLKYFTLRLCVFAIWIFYDYLFTLVLLAAFLSTLALIIKSDVIQNKRIDMPLVSFQEQNHCCLKSASFVLWTVLTYQFQDILQ